MATLVAVSAIGLTYALNIGLLKPGYTHLNVLPIIRGARSAAESAGRYSSLTLSRRVLGAAPAVSSGRRSLVSQ